MLSNLNAVNSKINRNILMPRKSLFLFQPIRLPVISSLQIKKNKTRINAENKEVKNLFEIFKKT